MPEAENQTKDADKVGSADLLVNFNWGKDFENEEKYALINHHRDRLKAHEELANTLQESGIKGRIYVVQRVFASRHSRRIKQLQSLD